MIRRGDWFAARLSTSWKLQPGRSCLLIVPPGCDGLATAGDVARWAQANDPIAAAGENRRFGVVRVTADAVSSSAHFARRVRRELAAEAPEVSHVAEEDYPADWIENIVAAAQSSGRHPLLVISRFHAFARIADDHLLSVLSTLRQLEHDGQLTTLAVSPMNYRMLREQLAQGGHFPFVNSAYGDNHDLAVMPPLSREEFVTSACKAGLAAPQANALFRAAGGPDAVHTALIEASMAGKPDAIDAAAARLENTFEDFFEFAIGSSGAAREDLRLRLATGRLLPAQLAFLRHRDLSRFLLKEGGASGELASPVLARLLLVGREGPWRAYQEVLDALRNGFYADAASRIAALDRGTPELEAFAGLVGMLAAIHDGVGGGLLEIGWKEARRIGRQLLAEDLPIAQHRGWIQQIVRWGGLVEAAVDPGRGRGARLDVLTRRAADADVRGVVGFGIRTFLARAVRNGSPGERVRAAASVPEAVLQALAASLGLDPLEAPDALPNLDYQRYFGSLGEYRRPSPGAAFDLTHLLVVVPAVLVGRHGRLAEELSICDPAFVKPLHQKLVAQMRNAAAHTYADIDNASAAWFVGICEIILADASAVWRHLGDADAIAGPTREELADLLNGSMLRATSPPHGTPG